MGSQIGCTGGQRTRQLSAPLTLLLYGRYTKIILGVTVLCACLTAPASATTSATVGNDCPCCAELIQGAQPTTLTKTIVNDIRATRSVSLSQATPVQAGHTFTPDLTSLADPLSLPRVASWSVPETCWKIAWPLPDTPMPVIDDVSLPQPSMFARPNTRANKITVYNFCAYDLWLQPIIGANAERNLNADVESVQHIASHGEYSRHFQTTDVDRGISLKVSKVEGNFEKPVQIEYTLATFGDVYFDLSLIDCLGTTAEIRYGKPVRNGNTSACAGHEAGLQFGNAQGRSFQCGAGVWCDDQAYLYEASQQGSRMTSS
jgi:hypothetical protein